MDTKRGYIPSNWGNCFISGDIYKLLYENNEIFAVGPISNNNQNYKEKYKLENIVKDGPITEFEAIRVSL